MIHIKKNCDSFFIITLFLLSFVTSAIALEENGLPVPRFVSLRSNEVNLRVGPGSRYNINWVYKRDGLPVEIIQEFDDWREIRDSEGSTGWVHKQMLQGKRSAIITDNLATLRKSPDDRSYPVIRAEAGVIAKIIECEIDWCKLQISGHKGWIKKTSIFGAYKKEKF
ncbi:MAG: SH3 domain-containing protein [Pseudomonadota bacterium]